MDLQDMTERLATQLVEKVKEAAAKDFIDFKRDVAYQVGALFFCRGDGDTIKAFDKLLEIALYTQRPACYGSDCWCPQGHEHEGSRIGTALTDLGNG